MNDLAAPGRLVQPLNEWLDCGISFRELVRTLDPEQVSGAAWMSSEPPNGLFPDGETFLRATGAATERFSRIAEALVRSIKSPGFHVLTFSVEAGDVVRDSEVAVLRIHRLGPAGRKPPTRAAFVPVGLDQPICQPCQFGAEGRIALVTPILDFKEMMPSVRFTYEVSGQQALKVFASILQTGSVPRLWAIVGGLQVETSILLTKDDDGQESIEEEWGSSDDPDGHRLLSFCRKVSRLSDEETRDWPPYLRLERTLDSRNTESDFDRYFGAICAHAICLEGPRRT